MRSRIFPSKFAFLMLIAMLAVPAFAQQPRKDSLLNGLKVLMFPDLSSDKVWVRIRVNSGSAFDPQGKEGLMRMLSANFFPTDAAKEYFRDELGGSLVITTNYDYIEVDASSKPEDLIQMLETLSGGITNTVIDKDTTAKLKADGLEQVRTREQNPSYIANLATAKRLFGTFPYGRPMDGTEDSIKKIELGDLLDAKQRFLTADNAAMTISGNFQPSRVLPAVKRYFGGWTKADRHIPATFRQPDNAPAGLLTVASPVAGKFAIRFALRGTSRSAADMAAADIFARVIAARLRALVPDEDADSVFATSLPHLLPGSILIGFGGTKSEPAGSKASDLLSKVLSDPITDAEFGAARTAAAAERLRVPVEELWLDADTYSTTPETDRSAFDVVTIAKVRDFAAWATRQPMASVLVTTPK